jgi:hypothetical protein
VPPRAAIAELDASRATDQDGGDPAAAARDRRLFSPGGQVVLPGYAGQQGLDGTTYYVESDSDRSPERASCSLGPHTEFRTDGFLPPTEAPLPGQLQLALDLEAWNRAPQLTMWRRLDVARDLVRGGEFDRDAKCNRTRFAKGSDVELSRSDRGAWSTTGTIKCNVWQTCPHCGPRKCREVASKLSACFERHLASGSDFDVWMLSLTIPHYADVRTELVVDQLYDAFDRFTHSKEWRTFVKRWGVVGRVRVLDATHGNASGSHPHFHIALFVERSGLPTEHAFVLSEPTVSSWTVDERGANCRAGVRVSPSALVEERERWGVWKPLRACSKDVRQKYLDEIKGSLVVAWEHAVRATGARIERPTEFRRRGVELTPSENAATYFTKWGLADEVGASTSKSRNHLRLLDAVAVNLRGAAYLWKQWRRAVHQHALVTGLGSIARRLKVTDDDARAWLDEQRRRREAELEREGTPLEKVPELRVVVRSHLYDAAMSLGWDQVFSFVNEQAARGRGDASDWLQRELDQFLWDRIEVWKRGPPSGNSS